MQPISLRQAISRDTHGYVGADLAALCTEAALQVGWEGWLRGPGWCMRAWLHGRSV